MPGYMRNGFKKADGVKTDLISNARLTAFSSIYKKKWNIIYIKLSYYVAKCIVKGV
jgi:hypothetical protein